MKTIDFIMCSDCAEIVVQGYTDAIESVTEHQARCNHIDKQVLPAGHYWLGSLDRDPNEHHAKCESCGVLGADCTVTAARS